MGISTKSSSDDNWIQTSTCDWSLCVDFYAPSVKLIIEVDGGQHLDLNDYEIDRSQFLSASGYRVLRFWNNDITNDIQSVIEKITQTIQDSI